MEEIGKKYDLIIKYTPSKGWYWLLEGGPHNSFWSSEYYDSIEKAFQAYIDNANKTQLNSL